MVLHEDGGSGNDSNEKMPWCENVETFLTARKRYQGATIEACLNLGEDGDHFFESQFGITCHDYYFMYHCACSRACTGVN